MEITSYEDNHRALNRAMWLSVCIGILMFFIKVTAFLITGSAAILSDAAESVVHVVAVGFAAYSLWLSRQPADKSHLYGHERISFFSAGFEGAMIVIAAIYILYEAGYRWIMGLEPRNLGVGALLTLLAVIINGLLGWYLVNRGKKHKSLILEANGRHVLTDSWTSLGVIIGLLLTLATGWLPFDPILAILVALNILWEGGKLIRRSVGGLMDESDPKIHDLIRQTLTTETQTRGIDFHQLKHRNTGMTIWIEFHLIFGSDIKLRNAHEIATQIEKKVISVLPVHTRVISHLETLDDHSLVHNSRGVNH